MQLSEAARRAIEVETNEVLVGAATAWEIATKFRLGKLPDAAELAMDILGFVAIQNFDAVPITVECAIRAGSLPGPFRDPFDGIGAEVAGRVDHIGGAGVPGEQG